MKAYKLEIWKTATQFHWHLIGTNGRIIDAGSQGFSRYRSVVSNLGARQISPPKAWKHGAMEMAKVRGGQPVWH